ncbi:hypothetical protein L7F22_030536 [Adiantum nelumboides]|nr:hypothetical protein [Adiantum nelumboides]
MFLSKVPPSAGEPSRSDLTAGKRNFLNIHSTDVTLPQNTMRTLLKKRKLVGGKGQGQPQEDKHEGDKMPKPSTAVSGQESDTASIPSPDRAKGPEQAAVLCGQLPLTE